MEKVLLGVGPTRINKYILKDAMIDSDLCRMNDTKHLVKEHVKKLNYFFGEGRYSFAIPGSGSVGMEACLLNFLKPDDTIVVGVAGAFGWRIVDMARRMGVHVIVAEVELGRGIQLEQIINIIKDQNVKMVCLVHLETSTGVLQKLDEQFSDYLRDKEILLFLDVVASYAGMNVNLDKWGVDIAYASTQKCLSCPAGLALVSYNDKAKTIMQRNKKRVNWCYDFDNIYTHVLEGVYPHTTPLFLLNMLVQVIDYIMGTGQSVYFDTQKQCGNRIKEMLEPLGFTMLPHCDWEAPQVKVYYPPNKIDSHKIINVLDEYGIHISPGIGKLSHNIIRIGTMGMSANMEDLDYLEEILQTKVKNIL